MKKIIIITLLVFVYFGIIDKQTLLDFVNLLWKFIKQHSLLVAGIIVIVFIYEYFIVKLCKPIPKCPRCSKEMVPHGPSGFKCDCMG